MPRTPRYHPDFDGDVIGGAEWYAKSSQSLALDFTQKVQDATLALLADPERRSAFEYGLRYWRSGDVRSLAVFAGIHKRSAD
jgi:hypothetical protein